MHPLRLLFIGLPELLVEPGQVRRPGGSAAGLSILVDSRDTATAERLDNLDDPYRVFRCRSILNCVDVCPKNLLPAAAIGKIKEMMVRRGV
jgi:succinate dehydrogenase / fumarate reductase, iron-sulfur subunit